MVPAAAPSLCLALLPLAAGHAHPHAHDHALLLLGQGQPIDGLQSELFAPWRSDACHDPTEWCWTGADGAASVDLGDGRYAWLFGDSLVSRVARSPARRVMDDAWLPASTGIIGAPAAGAAWRDMRFYWRPAASRPGAPAHAAEPLWRPRRRRRAPTRGAWARRSTSTRRAASITCGRRPASPSPPCARLRTTSTCRAGCATTTRSSALRPMDDRAPRAPAQFCAILRNSATPPPFLPAGDPNWILGTSIVVVDDARPANPTEWTYTAKHMPQTDATLNWFVAVAAAAAQPADHAADAIAERWELLGGPPGVGSAAYRRAHAEVVYLLGCTNCAPQRSAEKSAVAGPPPRTVGRHTVPRLRRRRRREGRRRRAGVVVAARAVVGRRVSAEADASLRRAGDHRGRTGVVFVPRPVVRPLPQRGRGRAVGG